MKRFPVTTGCLGAALTLAASGAHAQIAAPNPPLANPPSLANPPLANPFAPAPSPVAPVQLRMAPMPGSGAAPALPTAPRLDPAPRMAPMPGVEPIPNLAPSPFQRPSQRMAPMPGAGGNIPGVTPRLVLPVVPRVTPAPEKWLYRVPGSEPRRYVLPGTGLREYRLAPPATSTAPRPAAMVADDDFLYILRGDTVVKIDKKTLAVVGTTTLPASNPTTAPPPMVWGRRSDSLTPAIRERFGLGPMF